MLAEEKELLHSTRPGQSEGSGRTPGFLGNNVEFRENDTKMSPRGGMRMLLAQAAPGLSRVALLRFGVGQFVSNGDDIHRQELCCVLLGDRGHVGASSTCWVPVALLLPH